MKKHFPHGGDQRVIKKFALFPIKCTDGSWAWFETVHILQQYSYGLDDRHYWINRKLVDKTYHL